jgi:hypothetical protein
MADVSRLIIRVSFPVQSSKERARCVIWENELQAEAGGCCARVGGID